MFLRFWLIGRSSISVCLPFRLLIGHTLAGWACFCAFGCSVGVPLAFPTFILIGRTFAGWACFCAFGCSLGAPLAFLCLFVCLLAAILPVVQVFSLLVAQLALLQRFPAIFLVYWSHACWLCMFLRLWLIGRSSFRVSLLFRLLIGCTFAGWACFAHLVAR